MAPYAILPSSILMAIHIFPPFQILHHPFITMTISHTIHLVQFLWISNGGLQSFHHQVFSDTCTLKALYKIWAFLLMLQHHGELVLLLVNIGPHFTFLLLGRPLARIFAGLRQWPWRFFSTSLSLWAYNNPRFLLTQTIKGQLVHLAKVKALILISIFLSDVPMSSSWIFLSLLN